MPTKQVMSAFDVLNDAIEEKRKVRFTYNTYGTDFKLHPKRSVLWSSIFVT